MSKETTPNSNSIPPKADPAIHAANPFNPAFDPMAAWGASQQAFHKMFAEAQGRVQAFANELATLESQMYSRAKLAIETWAQLAQDALQYSAQLSAEARRLGLEAARKMSV